jgi:hypothetical protein
LPFTP